MEVGFVCCACPNFLKVLCLGFGFDEFNSVCRTSFRLKSEEEEEEEDVDPWF